MKYFAIKYRLLFLALAVSAFLITFQVAATTPLSIEQANKIKQELSQRNTGINQLTIFTNNIVPSLEMFVPGLGVAVGIYSSYSTGQALSAFATFNPALKTIFPLSVFFTLFAILELLAYGLAISRSGLLAHYFLTQKKNLSKSWKMQCINTAIEIGIVILILFIGSVVEWQILIARQHRIR